MPVATILSGGFALNNNPLPSSYGGANNYLPLLGLGGLLPLLRASLTPQSSTRWVVPEVSLG